MTYDPPGNSPIQPPWPPDRAQSTLRDDRRQRNLVIGLSIGAVVVLLVGIVAFAMTRSDGTSTEATVPTVDSTGETFETSTSTSSTSTTSSSTSTTSTTLPIAAVADAGPDLAVDRDTPFTLTAVGLAAETPDEAVRWTQTAGPDVTGGTGSLSGPVVVAPAPADVTTLSFRLDVAGTDGVATDDVVVRVFEDADRAIFVDGERGDDTNDGSLAAPLRTVAQAVAVADGRDVYIRSIGSYDTSGATLELAADSSIYGGFDANWMRDVSRRATINGAPLAVRVTGAGERWISAVELTSASGGPDEHSVAVEANDVGVLHVEDSRIVAGDGGESATRPNGGASVGVLVAGADDVLIERSTVNGGRGADGLSGGAVAGEASR
ncbi:MAG: hypothetical protein HKN44_02705, partial [Ilumatobacter sp.]|nr:hypothetical protein [Ilumatobacter sp.]